MRLENVEAWDVQTGKKLSVAGGTLVIEAEGGRKYAVDLKTRKITELPADKK